MWYFVLIAIILILLYIIYNLYSQVTSYDIAFDNEVKGVEERAGRFYVAILAILVKTYEELEAVDKNGAFSSDDEVGFTFKAIMAAIEETKHEIQELRGEGVSDSAGEVR